MACSQDNLVLPPSTQSELPNRRHGHDHALPRLFRAAHSMQQITNEQTTELAKRPICRRPN
jgi:hypothetical protein